MKTKFRSFNRARKFVRSLKLENRSDWYEICKINKIPNDIPRNPGRSYKNEWIGWGDWLGTGAIAVINRKFRSFEEARKFVRSLGLKNEKEWNKICKTEKIPNDIPRNPRRTYKKNWRGSGDWLGTGAIASYNRRFRSFKEARKFSHSLGLKNKDEWINYAKSGKKTRRYSSCTLFKL